LRGKEGKGKQGEIFFDDAKRRKKPHSKVSELENEIYWRNFQPERAMTGGRKTRKGGCGRSEGRIFTKELLQSPKKRHQRS